MTPWLKYAAVAGLLLVASDAAPKQDDISRTPTEPLDVIIMHSGIPERVFIGQSMRSLLENFPEATSVPFAQQNDASQIKSNSGGFSCLVMGPSPEEFVVASVGFNFGEPYEGVEATAYRTQEGIGAGSTVNDLLGTYGPPDRLSGSRGQPSALRRRSPAEDRSEAKKYWYTNDDQTITTYFEVRNNMVVRLVVNHLHLLEKHITRRQAD